MHGDRYYTHSTQPHRILHFSCHSSLQMLFHLSKFTHIPTWLVQKSECGLSSATKVVNLLTVQSSKMPNFLQLKKTDGEFVSCCLRCTIKVTQQHSVETLSFPHSCGDPATFHSIPPITTKLSSICMYSVGFLSPRSPCTTVDHTEVYVSWQPYKITHNRKHQNDVSCIESYPCSTWSLGYNTWYTLVTATRQPQLQ